MHPDRRKERIGRLIRRHRYALAGLSLLSLLVFLSALGGNFVWHDRADFIEGQHRITAWQDIPKLFSMPREQYRARHDGAAPDLNAGTWQPAVVIANSVSALIWGQCSACWHFESLLWHTLNVLLLYALGYHLFRGKRYARHIAFWAAALFAVHPATVNSVAWLDGRALLMASSFSLISLLLLLNLQRLHASFLPHPERWLLASTLLAMSSHEAAYLLPGMALLAISYGRMRAGLRPFKGMQNAQRQGLLIIGLSLIGLLLMRALLLGGWHFAGGYPSDSIFANIGNALRHLWTLIDVSLLPGEPVISDAWRSTESWGSGEIAALLGTLLMTLGLILGWALRHLLAFAVSWFLLNLIPVIGLFPTTHYHNEQGLYLALWGASLGFSYLLYQLWRPLNRQLMRGSEALAFTPLLIALMLITGLSNARWWEHDSLFESELNADPWYREARIELAKSALAQQQAERANQHLLAAQESLKTRKVSGYIDRPSLYQLLAESELALARPELALMHIEHALALREQSARSWQLKGQAQIALGRYAKAQQSLERSLDLVPEARKTLDKQADLGVALVRQQDHATGVALLQAALKDPALQNPQRLMALGRGLLAQQNFTQARIAFEQVIDQREDPEARAALAYLHWQAGNPTQSQANLAIALAFADDVGGFVPWVQQQLSAANPEQ